MGVVGKLRYVLGSAFMIGVAPEYFFLWSIWRGVSLVLPGWVYHWGDDKLYSLYQRLVLFFFETCTGVEVVFYGDASNILNKKESVLYLSNHQSTADWMVANMVAVRGNAIGNMRYVMKDALQLIPLYGYYFYAHGSIYVKRGRFNETKMINSLRNLLSPRISSWMIIFPEGTRYLNNPKVIDKSEKYAKDHNFEVLEHHLCPKSKGAWLTLRYLRQKFDAVYDVSVVYETKDRSTRRKDAPQLARFLMGDCERIHIYLRRIPVSDVPEAEEELQPWMHKLFMEKDRIVAPFYSESEAERKSAMRLLGGKVSRIKTWRTLSAFLFFFAISIPFAGTEIGRKLYLRTLVYGTIGSYSWLAIKAVC